MQTVLVGGRQPGPSMWKVSKGDHVLWILGIVLPSPVGMQWKIDEVRGVLADFAAKGYTVEAPE